MRVDPQTKSVKTEEGAAGRKNLLQTIALVFVFVTVFYFFIKLLFL